MRSYPGLRTGRRTIQVQVLRATVHVDNCMGVDPIGGGDEASASGTFRAGSSGVPAEIPGPRERSYDRTLLSFGTGLLCACRGTARTVRGSHRARRDHDWRGPAGQARLGSRRQGHLLRILQRNGQGKVFAVPARKGYRIVGLVRAHTRPGSLYYTDDWHAYGSLRVQGDHVVIRKERGRPKGRDHINGIEGFWSYAKNWLHPLRGVPRKHLHLFSGEIRYRFDHRSEDLSPFLYKLLRSKGMNEINPILIRNS